MRNKPRRDGNVSESKTTGMILRQVVKEDVATFFEQQIDPESNFSAAFTDRDPNNRENFFARWDRILNDQNMHTRTILTDGKIAGYVANFLRFDKPEVSYWLGKEFRGKGLATTALSEFLTEVGIRPIYARAVKDNKPSIRVLEKCGFKLLGHDKAYANARGEEVEEVIMQLS